MAHPLDGAELRVWRADRHFTEADETIQTFSDACKKNLTAKYHGNNMMSWWWFPGTMPEIPTMLPLIVSDAIHNLRAALDYIVYELARHDSGVIQDGTQFPIVDSPADFVAIKERYMRGVRLAHRDMIEALQPYPRENWTKTLRDISNPDKHRTLTALANAGSHHITYRGPESDLRVDPPRINSLYLDLDSSGAIYIAPPDLTQPPLMETLYRLKTEVSRTIELFKPEF